MERPLGASVEKAALGFRVHSGWAVAVAVGGSARSPMVVSRRRIGLTPSGIVAIEQPYHLARRLSLARAKKFLARSADGASRAAEKEMRALIEQLGREHHRVVGCGLVLASGRALPELARTLRSHALVHAAEGEHFRQAIIHAARKCRLPIRGIPERELYQRGAAQLRVPAGKLHRILTAFGKTAGRPWRADEKSAALAAWLALART